MNDFNGIINSAQKTMEKMKQKARMNARLVLFEIISA
jgi:hypothetical protein